MKQFLVAVLLLMSVMAFGKTEAVKGESFVLGTNVPAKLAFDNIKPGSVVVRSVYDPAKPDKSYTNQPMVIYEEGKDYVVDYKKGILTMPKGSRIPDYDKNDADKVKVFNHSDKGEWANYWYITYVDYVTDNYKNYFDKTNQGKYLPKTKKALENGTPIKYVAYGDSITAFGDCTDVENNEYHALWVKHLKEIYPKANITRLNRATGGDTAYQGVERLKEKVLDEKPDLVSIAFGMNDNNTISGIDQPMYADLLQQMIDSIKSVNPDCEFIILSSFHPKENWFYNSHKMDEFTKTAEKVAKKNNAAFVNIDKVMGKFFKIKGQSSLLSNNINHPSDWGHWIFYNQLVGATF